MKKLMLFAFTAALVAPVFAEEGKDAREAPKPVEVEKQRDVSAVWPAFFAVSQWPRSYDVIGLRLTIPFSTAQENVTGVDVGLWGKSIYFEGVQVNVLRNDVTDSCSGVQVGIYNSIGSGEMLGAQVGLWNEANTFSGAQVGLVNVAGEARGFQVGLVNRVETMYGYQVGLINVMRDAEIKFCPILNIGF